MIRTYSELITIPDFLGRFEYLKLNGLTCELNEEANRYLNQIFYRSPEWRKLRREILLRDNGCDLAVDDMPIPDRPLIHHLNPITVKDVTGRAPCIFDPENLVSVSHRTHNAIHYGSVDSLPSFEFVERRPNDTKLW